MPLIGMPPSPALLQMRDEITQAVRQLPDGEVGSLASGIVVEASKPNVDHMCPGFVESTFPHIMQHLSLTPQQLVIFRQRVAQKLRDHVLEFMNSTYQQELSQLLQAVTPNQDSKLIRERVDGMVRGSDEMTLGFFHSQINQLNVARQEAAKKAQAAQTPPASKAQSTPELEKALTAAALEGNVKTVQDLIAQGANIDSAPEKGWTALMNASLQGKTQVVQYLISARANLNLRDESGYTALMWSASYRRNDIVQMLVSAGADLTLKDSAGRDIWQYAQDPSVKAAIAQGQAKVAQARAPQQPQLPQHVPLQPFGGQFPPHPGMYQQMSQFPR
jgi:hypothetical protein